MNGISVSSPRPVQGAIAKRAGVSAYPATSWVLGYLGIHVPLAIAMCKVPVLATAHAMASLAVGLMVAISGSRPDRIVNMLAYITGAEVLWRMSKAPLIFWEYGKYAIIFVSCVAVVRGRRPRPTIAAWFYFSALLPSAALTASGARFEAARQRLSFNLSGPLALAACCAFFSRIRLSNRQVAQMLIVGLGPLCGVLAITVFSTATAKKLVFTGESNFETSGGFGPNQVSAALGFGVVLAMLLVVLHGKRLSRSLKYALLFLALAIAAQSALTFSRTGVYLAVGSLAVAASYGLRDPRKRASVIMAGLTCYLLVTYVIAPRLNDFTGGALGKRFAESGVSQRDSLARSDLRLWFKNPLFGVGPGMASKSRPSGLIAHTEFTRLLAEHGLFGLMAIVIMFYQAWRSLQLAKSLESKAFVAAMLSYGLLFMASTAMRLVLPAFAIGLTFATVDDE